MTKPYELINAVGNSITNTKQGYYGKMFVPKGKGIWQFSCDEDISENDKLLIIRIAGFGLLKVKKI